MSDARTSRAASVDGNPAAWPARDDGWKIVGYRLARYATQSVYVWRWAK